MAAIPSCTGSSQAGTGQPKQGLRAPHFHVQKKRYPSFTFLPIISTMWRDAASVDCFVGGVPHFCAVLVFETEASFYFEATTQRIGSGDRV
jgi:hypothetical protein